MTRILLLLATVALLWASPALAEIAWLKPGSSTPCEVMDPNNLRVCTLAANSVDDSSVVAVAACGRVTICAHNPSTFSADMESCDSAACAYPVDLFTEIDGLGTGKTCVGTEGPVAWFQLEVNNASAAVVATCSEG